MLYALAIVGRATRGTITQWLTDLADVQRDCDVVVEEGINADDHRHYCDEDKLELGSHLW